MRRAFTILGTLGLLTLGACSDWSNPIQPTYDPIQVAAPTADDADNDAPVRRGKLQ
jgi:hypothetical protein